MSRTRLLLSATALTMSAGAATAGALDLTVEIPRMNAAEYHRPYLAVWLQKADGEGAGTLQVWYDEAHPEKGRKYLKDLTSWWRKIGREIASPVDGVSGATRAPGPQKLSLDTGAGVLKTLPAGQYQIVVEAAREQGGHELVKLPLAWPPKAGASASGKGQSELGAVSLKVR